MVTELANPNRLIYARLAKEKIAHYLEVEKGHAILALTQVSYLDDGTAFEYVKSQYVGERFWILSWKQLVSED